MYTSICRKIHSRRTSSTPKETHPGWISGVGGKPLQGYWKYCNKELAIVIATTNQMSGVRSGLFLFVMLYYNLHDQTFYIEKECIPCEQ